jgi:hypothetical protein
MLDAADRAAGLRLPPAVPAGRSRRPPLRSAAQCAGDHRAGRVMRFREDLPIEQVIRIGQSGYRNRSGLLRGLLDGNDGWVLVRPRCSHRLGAHRARWHQRGDGPGSRFSARSQTLIAKSYDCKQRQVRSRLQAPPTHLHEPTRCPPARPFFFRVQRALPKSGLPWRPAGLGCLPHFAVSVSFRLNRHLAR